MIILAGVTKRLDTAAAGGDAHGGNAERGEEGGAEAGLAGGAGPPAGGDGRAPETGEAAAQTGRDPGLVQT